MPRRQGVFEFIEGWYNPMRRNQNLGQSAPTEFDD